ncbi:tRNA (adenosine(37)-N6)-threonylcarbamoyltransferase complex ATPase subunit type 1 TsaE [Bacteroidales bacterium]|nr:tRNA (adenosine(37)-N6)-threonylcarbamoyltransferase complex ATPase subunit type 1 TsaE [Bacteroidales bacterium]
MPVIKIENLEKINIAAKQFVELTKGHSIIAFEGEMAAGKTSFIKAICEELGVIDTVNSPTFSIINEYMSKNKTKPIYHFDFYRINNIQEALDIGIEDYFYKEALCLIEWPQNIAALLPPETLHVRIEVCSDGSRNIIIV